MILIKINNLQSGCKFKVYQSMKSWLSVSEKKIFSLQQFLFVRVEDSCCMVLPRLTM